VVEPERFLNAQQMNEEATKIVDFGGEEAKRYSPFCKTHEKLVCSRPRRANDK